MTVLAPNSTLNTALIMQTAPLPVTEGGQANSNRHKGYSHGERSGATQKQHKHAG